MRAPRIVAVVAAMCAVLLSTSPAHAAPPTADEQALLDRFSPVLAVRHQSEPCGDGERFLPVAVDTILGRDDVVLRDADGNVLVTAPTAADLAGGPEDRWIDLPGNTLDPGCHYEQWFDSLQATPAIYGRVTSQDGHLVTQYWFFYVYNQWNDVHEGDWEMAQLDFGPVSIEQAMADGPRTYAYAQHEGSEYATVGDNDAKLVRDGDHPVVFVAEGSHASFFSSSRWFGKSGATGFGCDDTTSPIDRISPTVIALPGDDVPTTGEFAWLSYLGHWGEKAPSFDNGPTGPVTKTQWSSPVTWVDDEGRDSAAALPFATSRATEAFCDLSATGSLLFNRLLDRPWLVLAGLAVVVAVLVLIVRRSSQGVLGRAWRAWRADRRRLLPIGALVLLAAAAAALAAVRAARVDPPRHAGRHDRHQFGVGAPARRRHRLARRVAVRLRRRRRRHRAGGGPGGGRPGEVGGHSPSVGDVGDAAVRRARRCRRSVFWPLAVLASRWIVAPVAATDTSATAAFGRSNRLVRGHAWRALGMLVTMALVASIAAGVGVLVLLLTPWAFWVSGAVVAVVGVVLVPYLGLVLVEFHRDLADP